MTIIYFHLSLLFWCHISEAFSEPWSHRYKEWPRSLFMFSRTFHGKTHMNFLAILMYFYISMWSLSLSLALYVAALFIEETIFLPLNCLGILIKNKLTRNVMIYFWTLMSISICSLLSQVSWCPGYYGFVRSFEIWSVSLPLCSFLSCFDYPESLKTPHEY